MGTIDLGDLQDCRTQAHRIDSGAPKLRIAHAQETIALAMTGIFEQLMELNSYMAQTQKQVYDRTVSTGASCLACIHYLIDNDLQPCASCKCAPTNWKPA
jgi:hypothetical protein